MMIVFVTMVCAAVSVPFIAMAWAMKPRVCPHCGGPIEADQALVRKVFGE